MSRWDDVQEAMQAWVAAGTGIAEVVWGGQDAGRPPEPGVTMRISNIAEINNPEVTFEDNPHTFDPITVTVDVAGNRLVAAGHNRRSGDGPIRYNSTTDDPPAPLVEDRDYWLIALDDDHLRVAETYEDTGGGNVANPVTPITLTDAGTGAHTISATDDTLRTGEEIAAVARTLLRVSLELRCYSVPDAPDGGALLPTSLLQRIRARSLLPSMQEILANANISLIEAERVRAILGIRDAVLFEPRAWMNVYFCVPVEESEYLAIIESVEATNLSTGQVTTIRR